MKIQIINKNKEQDQELERFLSTPDIDGDAEIVSHAPLTFYVASPKFDGVAPEKIPKFARTLITKEIYKKFKREGFEVEVWLI